MWIFRSEYDALVEENEALTKRNEELEQQIKTMRWEAAGDQNYIMREEGKKAWSKLHEQMYKNAELQAMVRKLELENKFYMQIINNMKARLTPEMLPVGKKMDVDAMFGTRKDGMSTKDVMKQAYLMYKQGASDKQIADAMGIDIVSVPAYKSKGKKIYENEPVQIENNTNGRIRRKEVPKSEIEKGVWTRDTGWSVVKNQGAHSPTE